MPRFPKQSEIDKGLRRLAGKRNVLNTWEALSVVTHTVKDKPREPKAHFGLETPKGHRPKPRPIGRKRRFYRGVSDHEMKRLQDQARQ